MSTYLRPRSLALATLATLLVAAFLLVGSPDRAAASSPDGEARWAFCKINDERRARGLAPLAWDATLAAGSTAWSAVMARDGYMRHDDALEAALDRAAPDWRSGAENVGHAGDGPHLHDLFMGSPGHRANILRPTSNRVGVGAARGADGHLWITHRFLQGPALPNPDTCPEGAAASADQQPGYVALPPGIYADVPATSYYAQAISWAGRHDVTTGCSFNRFCPGQPVNRGQLVTFLWRMAGRAALGGELFVDIAPSSVYAPAVQWVRAINLSGGCDGQRFCPSAGLTRAQLVTLLWRFAGQPGVSRSHGFTDVPRGAYYEPAVAWAVAHGITGGKDGRRFAPGEVVTRGQVMTMLHRYTARPTAAGRLAVHLSVALG